MVDVQKNPEKIANNILSNYDGNIICIDRFLGDEVIQIICQRINASNIGCRKLVLRGNCIGSIGAENLGSILSNKKLEIEVCRLFFMK